MKVQSAKVNMENSFQVYRKACPRLTAEAELSWISLQTGLRSPYRFLIGIDGSSVMKLEFCSLEEKPAVQGSSSGLELPLHLHLLLCPCLQVVLMAAVQPGDNVNRGEGVGWKSAPETYLFQQKLSCENMSGL